MDSKAKKRWGILADVIKSKQTKVETDGTKRSFKTYNILKLELVDKNEEYSWQKLSFAGTNALARYLTPKLSLDQLIGFNNTGNVCVWPSEECLAVYALQNKDIFRSKDVLELGGGMTALAGLLLANTSEPRLVHLTDGNNDSVQNLLQIVDRFKEGDSNCHVDAFELRWDDDSKVTDLYESYDVIMCADCLFFKESSSSLVQALYDMLRTGGKAIVMAPNREGTFGNFSSLARKHFTIEVVENYSGEIWKAHESYLGSIGYEPDIHYPMLMVLTKE